MIFIKPKPPLILELIASLVMISLTLPYLGQFLHIKITTSLENDELYSIAKFSQRGVYVTTTDYHAPNNHIFFNVLNAVTPFGYPYSPWRARLWAFIALSIALLSILRFYFTQNQFLEGALFFQLIVVNYELLDLFLKGRGYGFLFLCALLTSFFLQYYLQTYRLRWVIAIAILTVMGTWTIPNYVFFGGIVLLLLWLTVQKRNILGVGIATVLVIGLLYLPVLNQIVSQMSHYADEWGREFETIKAVFDVLKIYLLHPSVWNISFGDGAVLAGLCMLLILPPIIWSPSSSKGQTVRLLGIVIVLFFIICLKMRTPPLRTVSFVVIPFMFCYLMMLNNILTRFVWSRSFVSIGLACFFSWHSYQQFIHFTYLPLEDWITTARYIEQTFPDNMPISAPYPDYLQVYLPKTFPIERFSPDKFKVGQQVFVENLWTAPKSERIKPQQLSPQTIQAFIPQIRGDYQAIAVTPPLENSINSVSFNDIPLGKEAIDHDITTLLPYDFENNETQFSLQIYLRPNQYRSMYLLLTCDDMDKLQISEVSTEYQQQLTPISVQQIMVEPNLELTLTQPRLIRIILGNKFMDYLEIKLNQINRNCNINEIWAYPTHYQ